MDIKGKGREKGSALLQFCIKRSLKKDSVVCFAELLTVPRPWQHTANKVEGWSSSASLQTGQIKERTCKQQILSALAVTHLTASHCIKKKKKRALTSLALVLASQVLARRPGRGIRALPPRSTLELCEGWVQHISLGEG